MAKIRGTASSLALASFLTFGMLSIDALAQDLSSYRSFQLGTDLPTVAKQVGASPSQAKIVHRRPAFIQELEWRPQPLGWPSKTESAQDVVFIFYDGALYRIVVNYDRYQTEGLTAGDFIEGISANYGMAEKPAATAKTAKELYGDQEETLARWEDQQYRFDLIRSSFGPSFRLVGILKRLDSSAQAAIIEATRLDDQEAPQRDAERTAKAQEAQRVKLEQLRLVNKPKFRP